ncbi:YpoC family protein [Jeotgalibacillus sp. R-1-5s-1]|uniref:YpoC family protein n=1 Tax=Jeotgalibacillus sp. R-1-5s-1 TaxID=2555897 RepID=UPI00106D6AD9|nr:hypothetical protein [Jeotgalibacillus sp. R-1-5s-1]TFE03240.1 hypothetical protein E2491_00180 [Jeotgalibacillus sp. R-1-5s-1]
MSEYSLPQPYRHPLFYSEKDQTAVRQSDFEPYFIEDIIARAEKGAPWEEIEKWIPVIIGEWERLADEMRPLFEDRPKDTHDPMVKGLSLFFTLLFWTNEKYVNVYDWESELDHLEVKIVNPKERIHFVLKRPAVYFSFIQLDEMMTEMHKMAAKKVAMKKKSR